MSGHALVRLDGPQFTSPFTVRVPATTTGTRMDSADAPARSDDDHPGCRCEPAQGGFARVCVCTTGKRDGKRKKTTPHADGGVRMDGTMERNTRDDFYDPYFEAVESARADAGEAAATDTVQARFDAARKDPFWNPAEFWNDEAIREGNERGRRDAASRQGSPVRTDEARRDEFWDPYLDSADAAFGR